MQIRPNGIRHSNIIRNGIGPNYITRNDVKQNTKKGTFTVFDTGLT